MGQITNDDGEYHLYRRRWWILFVFSCLAVAQDASWLLPGSVQDTMIDVFETDKNTVNLMVNFGPIFFVFCTPVSSWMIERLGIKVSTIVACGLTAAGAIVRCFATQPSQTWIILIGQALNAIAGPICSIAPPAISSVWFGPSERTLATAVTSLAALLGNPIGFLVGLLAVDKETLSRLFWAEALFCTIIFVMSCIYFPAKPPKPPSASAAAKVDEKQVSLLKASFDLIKSPSTMIVILCAGTVWGFYGAWLGLLVGIMKSFGRSQREAQWMGVAAGLASVAAGLISGYIHDRYKQYKWMLVVVYAFMAGTFITIILISNGFIQLPFWMFATVVALSGAFCGAFYPLAYEACVELSYPIPEAVNAGGLTLTMNATSFLLLVLDDYISSAMIDWSIFGCLVASTVATMFIKQKYKRSNLDVSQYVVIQ